MPGKAALASENGDGGCKQEALRTKGFDPGLELQRNTSAQQRTWVFSQEWAPKIAPNPFCKFRVLLAVICLVVQAMLLLQSIFV